MVDSTLGYFPQHSGEYPSWNRQSTLGANNINKRNCRPLKPKKSPKHYRHYPIGLLYDIHGLQASSGKGMNGSLLPWKITVHFQNFPADKLIKSQAVDSCQDYFMSMIKEVCGQKADAPCLLRSIF